MEMAGLSYTIKHSMLWIGGVNMNLTWKTYFRIGLSAFLLFLGIYYWKAAAGLLAVLLRAVLPFFLGFAIAFVIDILLSFYERFYFPKRSHKTWVWKTRRPVCLLASLLTLAGLLALLVWLVVPELVSCIRLFLAEIPPALEFLFTRPWVRDLLPADVAAELSSVDWVGYLTRFGDVVLSGIGGAVGTVITAVTSVVSVIITVVVSLIFSLYLLGSKEKLQGQGKRLLRTYLPERWTEKIMYCLSVFRDSFRGYIVGQCTEAAILGSLCALGMFLFRFPYAGMIGSLVGFSALIPVAGAYIGAGIGVLMMLTVSPLKALLFLIFIVVLQQLEGNLIYPKVVGKSIGLPAIWVLAAVTVGGGLLGIPGMLFGVPTAAALYRMLREDVARREKLQAGKE